MKTIKKTRTPLAEARYRLKIAQDIAGDVAARLEEAQRDLLTARYDLDRSEDAAHRNALRAAHLEGYIERVREIEAIERQAAASQAAGQSQRDDAIAILRNHVANGPEEHAQRILDAIDSDPTGKTMEAVMSGDGKWAR